MYTVRALPSLSSLIISWIIIFILILAFIAIPIIIFIKLARKINNIESSVSEIKEKLDKNL
ncbi:hypothetical protein [Tissierella praeacuta]|uniref:hypothetical protein n=1 Tax=Tissierella praeacuta TaxID=43131 RepID=UPI0028AFCA48|nr:hypothetical protein [Tissierella praeacuta]